jgi:hypothetical protein
MGWRWHAKNVYLYCHRMLLEELPMATRRYNVPIHQDISTRYASDLNDQEFALIAPHVAQKDGSGKKRYPFRIVISPLDSAGY